MKSARVILSQNMKKYRENADISQEELAYRCGLHRTYISDVERCKRNISIENIEKIALALFVAPVDLLKEDDHAY